MIPSLIVMVFPTKELVVTVPVNPVLPSEEMYPAAVVALTVAAEKVLTLVRFLAFKSTLLVAPVYESLPLKVFQSVLVR